MPKRRIRPFLSCARSQSLAASSYGSGGVRRHFAYKTFVLTCDATYNKNKEQRGRPCEGERINFLYPPSAEHNNRNCTKVYERPIPEQICAQRRGKMSGEKNTKRKPNYERVIKKRPKSIEAARSSCAPSPSLHRPPSEAAKWAAASQRARQKSSAPAAQHRAGRPTTKAQRFCIRPTPQSLDDIPLDE